MAAPRGVLELVKLFESNKDTYLSQAYNEAQVRADFIDPLFEALGWDVKNRQGYAQPYREVILEDSIRIGRGVKSPDMSFRIGGMRKFFVECKKPSVDLKVDLAPAHQLRSYAWSAKLPLSILTDFQEFAVYDCRVRPVLKDKPAVARRLYIRYDEYEARWDEIASIFSRDAVLKGSFDRYAGKPGRGTKEVDDAFLDEIERWRELLAKDLAKNNRRLGTRELNYAVQQTIDRIIFLRICEDRGIEPEYGLKAVTNGANIYGRLFRLFENADQRYNSGLFHFRAEKGHTDPPDELTARLRFGDSALRAIIHSLYDPNPWKFDVMPADILGQVYEQFLGKVIHLTKGHHAKVEEKPEVRKAGGVYYTPTYIVDYIVKNTVGKLLEGKTPKQAEKLRILDPACGSGSFLIGAYQCLVDWHRDWYLSHGPEKHRKELMQAAGGEWRLTTAEKKKILLNNLYGVDIDPQAVEVTKLSLLLKVLEGENTQTLQDQLKLFHERALPDLSGNIKCGNSLIGPDFYEGRQINLLNEEDQLGINVFDWEKEFAGIMKGGGFDAVIGNPPYVDIKALPAMDVEYVFMKFPAANNRINLFSAFVEQSLVLSKQTGFRFSMIIPTAILTQESYAKLRKRIVEEYQIANVVRLPNESFGSSAGDVKVDTVIVVIEQKSKTSLPIVVTSFSGYNRISRIDSSAATVCMEVPSEKWAQPKDYIWALTTGSAEESILAKCECGVLPLEKCVEFSLGLTPYDKYTGHTEEQIKGKVFHATCKKDKTFKPLLAGNDVARYLVKWNGEQWISYGSWLGAAREQRFFTEKRILVKQIIDWTTKRIWASITEEELYNTQNAFNLLARKDVSLEYVLGVLNSKLMTFYHRKRFLDEFKMRFQKILIKDCKRVPIHQIDQKSGDERERHDQIVNLVSQMLGLHKRREMAHTPQEKTAIDRQISATDAQIDQLVYELYGLTKDEIAIVENSIR